MDRGNVVYLGERNAEAQAREFAVLFRVLGKDAQFKVFGSEMEKEDREGLASAMEAAARALRDD